MILGIETSCDDTCAAVVDGAEIRSNVISSQAAAHERYGGVVPEVASRHHLELLDSVVAAALGEVAEATAPERVEPIYLRRPDAEIWRERQRGERPGR